MNKMYLAIIGFLLVIALLVGGYAFYKTANQPAPISYPPMTQPVQKPIEQTQASKSAENTIKQTPKNIIPLTISSIKDGDLVTTPKLIFKGTTSPNADIAINEIDVKADSTGVFSGTLTLEEGDNPVEISASDESGLTNYWDGTITYEPAQ